jgi:hypothetical protein
VHGDGGLRLAPSYTVRGREAGGRCEVVRQLVGCTIIPHGWGVEGATLVDEGEMERRWCDVISLAAEVARGE